VVGTIAAGPIAGTAGTTITIGTAATGAAAGGAARTGATGKKSNSTGRALDVVFGSLPRTSAGIETSLSRDSHYFAKNTANGVKLPVVFATSVEKPARRSNLHRKREILCVEFLWFGAGEGNRTLDIQLGKLSFYH
jgi:hypothetical protein